MKKEDFFEVLGELDDNTVKGAKIPMKKKMNWKVWGTMAACLCLVLIAAMTAPFTTGPSTSEDVGGGPHIMTPGHATDITPTLFADQEVINEIATEIADEDINSWTEVDGATLEFDYTLPIYITLNMGQDSNTVLGTLIFDNQYMIPAMADGTCIGAFTVVKFENKWTISSYIVGLDIVQLIQSNKDDTTCLINIPQLNGEYGLLKISGSSEEYTPAPGFMTSGSESGEQLLSDAKRNAQAVENER